jgi:hypothetical protein
MSFHHKIYSRFFSSSEKPIDGSLYPEMSGLHKNSADLTLQLAYRRPAFSRQRKTLVIVRWFAGRMWKNNN